MQQIDTRRWLRPWYREQQRIFLRLLILSLSLLGSWGAMSATAESPGTPATSENTSAPVASQERFLQHFISRSLGQKAAAEHAGPPATATASALQAPPANATAASGAPSSSTLGLSTPTSTTVTTMVLSLGAILGCLLIVGYFVRRYLFSQTLFGKRSAPLRVLARTHLTPKAVVALLAVPGKTLVIGVTGSTLVTLGEAAMDATEDDAPPVMSSSPSFVTTLEESTHDLHDAEPGDETLLQVSERIQRKVSRLKQL